MNTVQMKCPNCGARMKNEGGAFVCDYCNSITLQIFSPHATFDATDMDLQKFTETLQQNKKNFVISLDSVICSTDVDSLIINKRLDMAKKALANADYAAVPRCLEGIRDVFAAERLKMLARYCVQDEQQLSMLTVVPDLNEVLRLCDAATRETYLEISSVCVKNVELRRLVSKGYELLKLNLTDEAIAYGRKLCNDFPDKASVWDFTAVAVNQKAGTPHDAVPVGKEMEFMRCCPDYSVYSPRLFRLYRTPAEQRALEEIQAQRTLEKRSSRKKVCVRLLLTSVPSVLLTVLYCLLPVLFSDAVYARIVLYSVFAYICAVLYGAVLFKPDKKYICKTLTEQRSRRLPYAVLWLRTLVPALLFFFVVIPQI